MQNGCPEEFSENCYYGPKVQNLRVLLGNKFQKEIGP